MPMSAYKVKKLDPRNDMMDRKGNLNGRKGNELER